MPCRGPGKHRRVQPLQWQVGYASEQAPDAPKRWPGAAPNPPSRRGSNVARIPARARNCCGRRACQTAEQPRARRHGAPRATGRAASEIRLSSSSELRPAGHSASSIERCFPPYEVRDFRIRYSGGVLAVRGRRAPQALRWRWPAKLTSTTGASSPRDASDTDLPATARSHPSAPRRRRHVRAPRIREGSCPAIHASRKRKHREHIIQCHACGLLAEPHAKNQTPMNSGMKRARGGERGAPRCCDEVARNATSAPGTSEALPRENGTARAPSILARATPRRIRSLRRSSAARAAVLRAPNPT